MMDAIDKAAVELADELAVIDAEAKANAGNGLEWLPSYYTKKIGQFDDDRERLKAGYEAMLRAIDRQQAALEYRWGTKLQQEIDRQFSEGVKGKSIRNQFGTIGYRKIKANAILDNEDAAFMWAKENYPDAINPPRTIPETLHWCVLKKYIEETGEDVPGIEYTDEYQKFYIKPEPLKLEKK
jgi:hypothetical protein